MSSTALANLPQVDKLLKSPSLTSWSDRLIPRVQTYVVRKTVEEARQEILSGQRAPTEEEITQRILERFSKLVCPNLKRTINATGIILHTNLGRAPIGKETLLQMAEELSGYCNLVLILNALSLGKETLISRGELIQIGGGFRMPDILLQSGACIKEVGTTNITELRDYESALNEKTALILKVHPSCFHISGHTHAPSLSSLSSLSKARGLPLAVDWGSGSLESRESGEVAISEILESGCDVLSFSGDKLFGASQAGILVGNQSVLGKLKKSPLYRALRLGKLDLFVLEETLRNHLSGKPSLVDQLLRLSLKELEERAERFVSQLVPRGIQAKKSAGKTPIGGGSTPSEELDSVCLEIAVGDSERAARKLAGLSPPILVRKEKGKITLDLRTLFPADEALLLEGLSCLS
ncbi:L-seryl-tRNA(Sec) selenium transferase [bacterium]|nr:L-seryl-tRNA(Sec) selenium transferase [bacterium]